MEYPRRGRRRDYSAKYPRRRRRARPRAPRRIFGIVFFTSLGLMEGKNTDEIQTKIKNDLPTAVTGSWAYWVPAHFVNFRFIPGEQRLLYINGMQIMYNIFLSFLGNRGAPEEVKKE